MRLPGAIPATLAAALNPGDTTITLTDAPIGWKNTAGTYYNRNLVWYGYTNAKGYTYPDYTYSRTSTADYADNVTNGAWAAGGITGAVITLRAPWTGPAIPAGRAVANNAFGGSYKYIAAAGVAISAGWVNYPGKIGGYDVAVSGLTNLFPYGTAFVRGLFLLNRDVAGVVTNLSGVSFTDSTNENLDPASATQRGLITLVGALGGTADAPTTPTAVHLTGAETIAGVKTFSSPPIVPTPVGATDAAQKAYVDAAVAKLPIASASGLIAITPSGANVPTSAAIAFPAGRFASPPAVMVTAASAVPGTGVTGVGVTNVSATGATIWVTRSNTTNTSLYWHATLDN